MKVDDFAKEAEVMMKISHPNLLQILGVCITEEPIFIVTELMENGSLLKYLRDQDVEVFEMINIISQIAKGDNHFIVL